MPKVREAIKLIEADGWRTVTTKGSHRQVKYQRRTAQPLTRPAREDVPGRFWLMVEVLSTIFRRNHEETRLSSLYVYNHTHILSAGSPCFCRQARAEN